MSNAVTALLDARLDGGQAGHVAVVTDARPYSYAEVGALASRAGHAFRALGVQPEQRVALLLPDGPAWVAAFLGALRIGAVAVPMNPRLGPDEHAAILEDSRARLLVAEPAAVRALGPRLGPMPRLRILVSGGGATGEPSLEVAMGRAPDSLAAEPMRDEDMALWLYTSGTTGSPKAAVHLHRDLVAGRPYAVDVLGLTPADRVLATSRLFFAYALGTALLIPFLLGASTCLAAGWPEPLAVAETVSRHRPTILFSVPTFYARMLRADLPPDAFRSLRFAVSAGERLPPELHRAYRERFGLEILDGMGATETIFMVLSNRPGRSRPGSSGTPVPGVDVRLLDGDGREAGPGEEGILHVRMASASPFYWARVEASRRAFAGGWFRTGDVYARDADGYYHHLGREDDRFKVAGQWVAPAQVEAALLAHPDVADAGVVGLADAGGLVKACAFVVARDGAGPELAPALYRLAEHALAPHQRPRRILVVPELPRTATGKLQRFRLAEAAAAAGTSES